MAVVLLVIAAFAYVGVIIVVLDCVVLVRWGSVYSYYQIVYMLSALLR